MYPVPLRRAALRIALASVFPFWLPVAAMAQDVTAAAAAIPDALDPDSPMAPLPGLGVDWPDPSAPDAGQPGATPQADGRTTSEQRYRLTIEGLDAIAEGDRTSIRRSFNELSTLEAGKNKSANAAQIDRRAREDEAMLRDLLRAAGYYGANVRTRVDSNDAATVQVTLEAEPGALYRFGRIETPGLAATGTHADTLRQAFPVKPQDPVDAGKVIAAETSLRTALGRQGFPFAKVEEPEVVIDHETQTATLTLDVEPGQEKNFGAIAIKGRKLFSTRHLGRIARFHPGDRFDAGMLDDFRRALIQTGLVSSVTLTPVEGTIPGTVDIDVALERAPVRTVAGELGYGTGEGYRAEISWQHRNLIQPEGAVTFRGVAGTQEQSLGASLRRSNFKQRDQVLTAQIVASHTKRDAYDAKTFTIGGGIERQTNIIWQKKWTWSAGAELIASDERDVIAATGQPRRRTFFIGALPTSLSYDGSDDLLNPTRGYRLAGRLSPEVSLQDGAFGYARAQIDGSAYLPLGATVLAGRIRLGTIAGASVDRIAPSRRFYSGGGGSVRGYSYQAIGPRDVNNDPIGGRSLAEFSIEARVRFGNFGVVPFLDGGNLYTQALPRFTGLRYGAGLGARYYTSFGPIRIDLGTPVNRRPGDARVTVFVSLGQAF